MPISLQSYPFLANYAIIASSGITTVSQLTITNGTYGSNPTAPQLTGITGILDQNNVITAKTELTDLVVAIKSLTSNFSALPGSLIITPGVYKLGSTTINNSSITFDAGGNPNAQFFIISSSNITLNNILGVTLINGASACNIFWLAGTAITMTGTVPQDMYGIMIGGSQVTFDDGLTVNGPVYAQTANVTFAGDTAPSVIGCVAGPTPPFPPTPPSPLPPVCFVKGTKIMTNKGFVPIEDITLKDYVVTSGVINNKKVTSTGLMKTPIVFIGHFSEHNLTKISRPIVISKNALGENIPSEDVRVSPNHAIVINNTTVHAKDLVNDDTIYQDMKCDSVVYYHIMGQNHFTLNSNGMWSESLKGCAERFTESMSNNLGMRNNTRLNKNRSYR